MINMEKYEILKRDYIALESVSKQLTEHIDFLNNEIEMLKFQLKAADSVNEQLQFQYNELEKAMYKLTISNDNN